MEQVRQRVEAGVHIRDPLPCQRGAVFPDTRAAQKRLKTFLYYYSVKRHANRLGKLKGGNDDQQHDDDQDYEDDDDID
jgi:hypothetical protein